MVKQTAPCVVFQPATHHGIQEGISQIASVVRPTLGPITGVVANDRPPRKSMPELLDSAGVAVRRIVELPDRDEDVGAMFLRHVLWNQHEEVGDGTATTAVLFQSIYDQGVRYLAAGGNAMRLRHHLEQGVRIILDELERVAVQLVGKEQLARAAESVCHDPPLAAMLGEIFDIVGEHGQLDIRTGRSRELEREYMEGMYWPGGILSRQMITDQFKLKARLENAAIIITDLALEDPGEVVPLLELALQADIQSLCIVTRKVSDGVTALLLANRERNNLQTIAVKTPGATIDEQIAALEDLAVLTGGRPLLMAAGASLKAFKLADFGHARRVWADPYNFGIGGGQGNPRALRAHVASLRSQFATTDDAEARKQAQQRIGKLIGGSATLFVGGTTETEITRRKELAERTAQALRGALSDGVVPGGGAALLACRPRLQRRLDESSHEDERAAYRILLGAVAGPGRTIITNAGYEATVPLAEIAAAGQGYGFDACTGAIVDMVPAGILDAAAVQKAATQRAITSAALALTIDVVVHRKKREVMTTP